MCVCVFVCVYKLVCVCVRGVRRSTLNVKLYVSHYASILYHNTCQSALVLVTVLHTPVERNTKINMHKLKWTCEMENKFAFFSKVLYCCKVL